MAELIVALDVDSAEKALNLADKLAGIVSWYKIGLKLFIMAGSELILKLKKKDCHIFLDLKFYDIPNTVAAAVRETSALEIEMLTLHCQGGEKMCKAALNEARLNQLLLGVTALTSFSDNQMPGIKTPVQEYAEFLAGCASSWGLGGIVCSPQEVGRIKSLYPSLVCVCPGIRLPDSAKDDQVRTATPFQAAMAGAEYLVCGRPILSSLKPEEVASRIIAEIKHV